MDEIGVQGPFLQAFIILGHLGRHPGLILVRFVVVVVVVVVVAVIVVVVVIVGN